MAKCYRLLADRYTSTINTYLPVAIAHSQTLKIAIITEHEKLTVYLQIILINNSKK